MLGSKQGIPMPMLHRGAGGLEYLKMGGRVKAITCCWSDWDFNSCIELLCIVCIWFLYSMHIVVAWHTKQRLERRLDSFNKDDRAQHADERNTDGQ